MTIRYNVPSVPYFLFFKAGQLVDRLQGANALALSTKFNSLASSHSSIAAGAPARPVEQAARSENNDLNARLAALVHSSPVMLFMKGSPDAPKCGFSRRVVEALRGPAACASFGHFDILSDDAVREGLKTFSDWPTYPQLYIRGELIGGCDIVEEMAKNGELAAQVLTATSAPPLPPSTAAAPAPVPSGDVNERIKALLVSHSVMLFMKGACYLRRGPCFHSRECLPLSLTLWLPRYPGRAQVRVQQTRGRGTAPCGRLRLRHVQHSGRGRPGHQRRPQEIQRLADVPAAVQNRRAARRLRHCGSHGEERRAERSSGMKRAWSRLTCAGSRVQILRYVLRQPRQIAQPRSQLARLRNVIVCERKPQVRLAGRELTRDPRADGAQRAGSSNSCRHLLPCFQHVTQQLRVVNAGILFRLWRG